MDDTKTRVTEILEAQIKRAQAKLDSVLAEQRIINEKIVREKPAYGTELYEMREGLEAGKFAARSALCALQALVKELKDQALSPAAATDPA